MLDTVNLRALRGQRVQITSLTDTIYGVVEGVTDQTISLTGGVSVPRSDVIAVTPAPLYCAECGNSVVLLHDGVCASCFRKAAARRPPVHEPCEVCGRPAIRKPGTDLFLCATHHAEAGNRVILHGSAGYVLAECYTEDTSSDKHVWKQLRGARFRCIRCHQAEKWDTELLHQLRDELDP